VVILGAAGAKAAFTGSPTAPVEVVIRLANTAEVADCSTTYWLRSTTSWPLDHFVPWSTVWPGRVSAVTFVPSSRLVTVRLDRAHSGSDGKRAV